MWREDTLPTEERKNVPAVESDEANRLAEIQAEKRNEYKDVKYYNVKKHERIIIILMIVVFICIILVTPWIIATIDLLFRQIPGWGDFEENTNTIFNIGVLPDFLGGAVGAIVGFIGNKTGILDKIANKGIDNLIKDLE